MSSTDPLLIDLPCGIDSTIDGKYGGESALTPSRPYFDPKGFYRQSSHKSRLFFCSSLVLTNAESYWAAQGARYHP